MSQHLGSWFNLIAVMIYWVDAVKVSASFNEDIVARFLEW